MSDTLGKLKGKPFGKPVTASGGNLPSNPSVQRAIANFPEGPPDSSQAVTSIGSRMTIEGKITGDGTVTVFGRVKGELRATTVMIADGAELEGDLVAEDLTVGGNVTGTIHAGRVRLSGTAVVKGDIYHRSLTMDESARFEGSSRREENPTGMSGSRPARPTWQPGSTPASTPATLRGRSPPDSVTS